MSSLCCFLNFLIYTAIIHAATIAASASAEGIAIHTPSVPNSGGRMMSIGSRNSNCLDRERNMLILAFQMLWKKLVITI